ncbi:hypothetical protein DFO70_11079 [Cytobacillus firmus]|uniref:DUF4871 domain-containing protein n=2 Tax=Cytobacillus TaxID=2675230 RepID=A0A366JPH7_CYTFI|nr:MULTISPECIES: hypothetical protein [Cytobacillus]RBP89973.1 hypothetical protein DFO70_11079 [Cytobacillus firmus]TDX40421.1 hypothetical protein DFO72_10990 [Cytobacillus oceanisediminis]
MESKLKQLRRVMDSTTHKGDHFTEFQKMNIRKAVHTDRRVKPNKPNKFVIFAISTFAYCLLAFFVSTEIFVSHDPEKINGSLNNEWEIRHEYKVNQNIKFSILPDPYLKAGTPYGYIFSFAEPFDTYKGKELSISALHKETGERIQVLPHQEITEPSSGYPSLQRFTTTFTVPYEGLWKYEVYLDGKAYGDVVVSVAEKAKDAPITLPEDIPDFVQESDFDTIDWERKAVEFGDRGIIGNENKSGVIGAGMPSLNGQKWMWHLWGVEDADLTIVGFHKESQTVHQILTNGMGWTIRAYGPNNGADAHTPSSVKIPKKGEWAILLYVDGELFDQLIYDINE